MNPTEPDFLFAIAVIQSSKTFSHLQSCDHWMPALRHRFNEWQFKQIKSLFYLKYWEIVEDW